MLGLISSTVVDLNLKWRPRWLLVPLLGIVALMPISHQLGESEIFYVQIAVFLLASVAWLGRPEPTPLVITGLDRMVIFYVVWVLVSFAVNLIASLVAGQDELNVHRLLSLFAFGGVFLLPYFVGRCYINSIRDYEKLFTAMLVSGFAVMIYFLWTLTQSGLSDLYASRQVMYQRVPMVIGFLSVLALVYAIGGRSFRPFPLSVWALGMILVGLSLTRAVYLQVAVSTLVAIAVMTRIRIARSIAIIICVALVLVVASQIAFWGDWGGKETITGRVWGVGGAVASVVQGKGDLSFSGLDESGSLRLFIWNELLQKISDNPLRWVVGFGQLGPSYIGGELVSNAGVEITQYSAHSDYIDVLVRTGVVGLCLLLAIWWAIVRNGFLLWSRDRAANILFVAHSAALLGAATYSFFHESTRYPLFGMYFWLYAGFVAARLSEREPESGIRREGR